MARLFVVSVMAKDRPGIVSDVTSAIVDLDGNLADISQTVLRGYFTMILLASFPDSVDKSAIMEKVASTGAGDDDDSRLEVSIKETSSHLLSPESVFHEKTYVLTAEADDHSGLVAKVSSFCKERGINILDLATRLHEGRYTMIFLLDLSSLRSLSDFRSDLDSFSADIGLETELQHRDIFVVTNEV